MWQNFIGELTRTMNEIVQSFARFLPRVLEMLLLVLVVELLGGCGGDKTWKHQQSHEACNSRKFGVGHPFRSGHGCSGPYLNRSDLPRTGYRCRELRACNHADGL